MSAHLAFRKQYDSLPAPAKACQGSAVGPHRHRRDAV